MVSRRFDFSFKLNRKSQIYEQKTKANSKRDYEHENRAAKKWINL